MSEWLFPDLVALLFDVDGTLCDSASLHHRAWSRALRGFGMEAPSWGRFVDECLRNQRRFEDLLPRDEVASHGESRLYEAKSRAYRELAEERLRPLPGVAELWARARALGLRIGVVSTGRRPSVDATLRRLDLDPPDVVLAREDVEPRTKPDPWGFELAARKLAAAPAQCLAFEDSPPGIRAARSAKMFCVGMASGIFPASEQDQADIRVPSFSSLRLDRADPEGIWLRVDPGGVIESAVR